MNIYIFTAMPAHFIETLVLVIVTFYLPIIEGQHD